MTFADITDDNIDELLNSKDSKSTQRVVTRTLKIFRDFLLQKGESADFESYPKEKFDKYLKLFYASARKKDGEQMKKNSITVLKYGLTKYAKEHMQININNDPAFIHSKNVYSAVLSDLKKKGLGGVDHKPVICKEDLIKLYHVNTVALNPNTPQGLINKCWFDVMTFLCRRGRENLRSMTRDTFKMGTDGSGRQFVMQARDEKTKNHTAADDPNDTIGEGKMYERLHDPMCPVSSFRKYVSKLNPDNTAFWQNPCNTFSEGDKIWYTRAPIGKNTLSSMMSNISKLAHLSRTYTNHSIRATSITEMDEAGIATRHIMRISGHKTEESIKHYSQRLSDKKKREISDCLSNVLSNNANSCDTEQISHLPVKNIPTNIATVSIAPKENVDAASRSDEMMTTNDTS